VHKAERSSATSSPKKRSRTVTTQRQPSKRAAASAVKQESYSSDDSSSSAPESPPRSRVSRKGGSNSSSYESSSRARCAEAVQASDPSSFWAPAVERRGKAEYKETQQQQQGEQSCTTLSLKRASFSPSAATGLVGLAENAFIASFLIDFKPFMPIVSERPVQSALAKFLKPFDR
jgi:Leucine-rich repeat (LRR) protein